MTDEPKVARIRIFRQVAGKSLLGRPRGLWMMEYQDDRGRAVATRPTTFNAKANGHAVRGAVAGAAGADVEVFIDLAEWEATSQFDAGPGRGPYG
jgi:hypothetical protein